MLVSNYPSMSAPQAMSPPGQPQMQRTSGKAVASLVLGICALCLGWIPFLGLVISILGALLAVILGAMGMKEVDANPQAVKGKGMAVAGLVLGIVGLVLWLIFAAIVVTFLDELSDELGEEPVRTAIGFARLVWPQL